MTIKTYSTKILGSGKCHPSKKLTNNDLSSMMDTSHEWIVERTGIHQRQIADDTKEEWPSVMAYHATLDALKEARLNPNDIELILFSITYSEMNFPNTAALLQQKLGINNMCPCLDINAACTGWTYGMEVADSLIKIGKYKTILLVGADQPSAFLNWEDRNTAVLFGDGCGVVLLGQTSENDPNRILNTMLMADSAHAENLALTNGGIRNPLTPKSFEGRKYPFNLHMDGKLIFKSAIKTMSDLATKILEKENLAISDVDHFIPHQANLRIIEGVAKRLEFPLEKVLMNIADYGNTSSATIPSVLKKFTENGTIKKGDLILMTAFGSGLTAGAILVRY